MFYPAESRSRDFLYTERIVLDYTKILAFMQELKKVVRARIFDVLKTINTASEILAIVIFKKQYSKSRVYGLHSAKEE